MQFGTRNDTVLLGIAVLLQRLLAYWAINLTFFTIYSLPIIELVVLPVVADHSIKTSRCTIESLSISFRRSSGCPAAIIITHLPSLRSIKDRSKISRWDSADIEPAKDKAGTCEIVAMTIAPK